MPALILIAFCTVVGALLGDWRVGLAAGLGLVLVANVSRVRPPY